VSASSASAGDPAPLGRRALKALAERYGVRPSKSLGQHFLADPNLARRIAEHAGAAAGVRILEVGAGLGSLTVALADLGAGVLAVEIDRGLARALEEVVADRPNVRVVVEDAVRADWPVLLGDGPWTMASNLPYNVAVPVVMDLLEQAPNVRHYVVMVQREVGERLGAGPGDPAYGAVSVRVAYRADARILRRVPRTVFWPEPKVESVVLELTPHEPRVAVEAGRLFRVVEEGFAQRRKTMANALVRLGMERADAVGLLASCGIEERARPETLSLEQFACIAEGMPWSSG
jgi:16S rRNA (adenine1518-N6/adenine1519-N6)-dimethyltransferase